MSSSTLPLAQPKNSVISNGYASRPFALFIGMETVQKNLRSITLAIVALFAILAIMNKKSSQETALEIENYEQLRNQIQSTKKIKNKNESIRTEKLRSAFTGEWFKNDVSELETKSFEFTQPENTRNQVDATKNKKNNKKKIAKSKKKTKVSYFKSKKEFPQRRYSGLFRNPLNNGITTVPGAFIPRNNNDTEKQPEQKLTADQWYDLLKEGKEFSKFIQLVRTNKVSSEIYYDVIERLIQNEEANQNKIGYRLLSQIPSTENFVRHYGYLAEEQEEPIQQFAKNQLEVYKSPANLRILNALLSNENNQIKLAANTLIKEVVETLLASTPQNPPVEPGAGDENPIREPSSAITRYRTILQSTLNILTTLLTNGGLDSEVTTQFTQTKDLLTRLFS